MKTLNFEGLIEKVPSLQCDKCGSTHVINTKSGLECDECNRVITCKEETLSFGIDVSEDFDNLTKETI